MPGGLGSLSATGLAKVLVPAVAVAAGAVFAVSAGSGDRAPDQANAWVDAPFDGAPLAPGPLTVQAHVSAPSDPAALTLVVDGLEVATTSAFTRVGRLAYATLGWDATVGTHQLWVRTDALTSAPVTVFVSALASLPPSPTPSPSPSTAPSSPSTSPSAPHTPAPPAPTPVPTPTSTRPASTPTPRPTPTPTPTARPPVVSGVSVSPARVYNAVGCGPTQITVTASASGATSVTFTWTAGSTSGRGTLTLTRGLWKGSSDLSTPVAAEAGPLVVTVVATGPGGRASSTASAVVASCKP